MKVYVVLKLTMLGPLQVVGIYADEVAALRVANESVMMRVEAHELIGTAQVSLTAQSPPGSSR
jgi:hypothetical protein